MLHAAGQFLGIEIGVAGQVDHRQQFAGARLGILADKGSLYVTRPTSGAYFRTASDLRTAAEGLFNLIELGRIRIPIDQTWPLAEAAEAHRALEGRQTTGSTLLLP